MCPFEYVHGDTSLLRSKKRHKMIRITTLNVRIRKEIDGEWSDSLKLDVNHELLNIFFVFFFTRKWLRLDYSDKEDSYNSWQCIISYFTNCIRFWNFFFFFYEVRDFSFFDSCSEILFLDDVAQRTWCCHMHSSRFRLKIGWITYIGFIEFLIKYIFLNKKI